MSLLNTTDAQREAASICDLFGTAIARGSVFSKEAVLMAADWMESPGYMRHDDEDREIVEAFVKWLRQKAED